MGIGVYAGSFYPWHQGHEDILEKALRVFDVVVIAQGVNPEKSSSEFDWNEEEVKKAIVEKYEERVQWTEFSGFLYKFAKDIGASGIIRGLRNGNDLQYEMNQQYLNEDLGMKIPTVFFICDRGLSHISSSALRAIAKVKNGQK